MGQTMSEKIIGEHAGKEVKAGDNVVAKVDFCFAHDASGPLVIDYLRKMNKVPFDKTKVAFLIDHAVPSPTAALSNEQSKLRNYARESGARFYEAGSGICHQVVAEEEASPGCVIIGSDSHTCTAGALGSFSTGMGATDVAVAMALGKTWLRVPESFKIMVNGKLTDGVYSKDLILHVISKLGADGASYKTIEFLGDGIMVMPISERLTLTNMAVEVGAKTGIIPTDETTREYLERMGRGNRYRKIEPDEDATYEMVMEIEGKELSPMVALPHLVDNAKPVEEVQGEKIDVVFVGSCTNARLEDLRVAAKMLKGRSISARLIVTPASRRVYEAAVKEGIITTFLEVGAIVTPSGCGMCFGALGGIPADGERVLTTTNRNFKGRTGNPSALTFLASPATAAATAIEGRIADPRDYS